MTTRFSVNPDARCTPLESLRPHRNISMATRSLLLWILLSGIGLVLAARPPATTLSSLDRQLLTSAADGSAADVRHLIQNGAHVNAQDRFGVTPLMQAVIGNNVTAVQVLIGAHADLNLRNIRGDTALDLAQELGRADIERLLTAMP
jgi:ankyrin repeat protein